MQHAPFNTRDSLLQPQAEVGWQAGHGAAHAISTLCMLRKVHELQYALLLALCVSTTPTTGATN